MAAVFREQLEQVRRRDIRSIQAALAVARKKERKLKVFKRQTDVLLQVVPHQTQRTRTAIVWSLTGVDAQTQTDQSPGPFYSEETGGEMQRGTNDNLGASQALLSLVYETLENGLIEMANKGIQSVLLSDWLVSLLAIIRRLNPTESSFSNYYYKDEMKARGTPLHMLRTEASVRFMSALDRMCTYSPNGIGKGLFSDSELLLHYAVAHASRLANTAISYVQFCKDPLSYTVKQLTGALSATIQDIVNFVSKTPPLADKATASAKWFPPSYIQVVESVNGLLQTGGTAVKNSVLIQFLPLTASTAQKKPDMSNSEAAFLATIIRTALIWHLTYSLSSTVQGDSTRCYQALLNRCMIRDGIVIHSLYSANKGPYLSTGMLLPGMFAYLFYISKEAGMAQRLGMLSLSEAMGPHPSRSLTEQLRSWRITDFGVRDKMASFICGDSVLKSSVAATSAAFPATTRSRLQAEIDCTLASFMQDILMHKHAYNAQKDSVIDYLKEVSVTSEYLQVSQRTRRDDYNMTNVNNMTRTAMTGFLKNPFLYKMRNTMHFDTYGRESVRTNKDTVLLTPIGSQ
jgi:hypothetical protein